MTDVSDAVLKAFIEDAERTEKLGAKFAFGTRVDVALALGRELQARRAAEAGVVEALRELFAWIALAKGSGRHSPDFIRKKEEQWDRLNAIINPKE